MNDIRIQKPYLLAKRVKRYVQGKLKQFTDPYLRVVPLKPLGSSRGNVLLSYRLDPFLLKPGQSVSCDHTNHWESLQIARTFLDLGYSVDAIHYTNQFFPAKDYEVFIDARWNLQRLAPLLNRDCLKIMHVDTAHILYMNAAESQRLLALQQRKGVTLRLRRFEWPNLAIEYADCAIVLGNEFTCNTFRYANKPLYRVPISNAYVYPWPEAKDFRACRTHYLWFGSGGLVHKGLDLVLEAFAGMPDYHLTICGPIGKEEDFERAYQKELYETPNIETIGWVDVASPKFLEITSRCVGILFPSCSEGGGGGVITCLHAGLIPIITYESSVDVQDFGMILPDCSIEEIQKAVRHISNLPTRQLEQMARGAWEFARANHTREKFAQEYRNVIEHILATKS